MHLFRFKSDFVFFFLFAESDDVSDHDRHVTGDVTCNGAVATPSGEASKRGRFEYDMDELEAPLNNG